jgi:hypothetical protein
MEANLLKILAEGGVSGVLALVCLGLMVLQWRMAKLFNKTLNNHIQHMELAYDRNAESMDKLSGAISAMTVEQKGLSTTISGCKNNKLNR